MTKPIASALDAMDLDAIASEPWALTKLVPYLDEFKRRRAHPVHTYSPDDHPKRNQLAFHKSLAPIRMILGGNQSGKSKAAARELGFWLREDHPYQPTPKAPRIYVVSAEYLTIEQGIWRHLRECLPDWEIEEQGPNVADRQVPAWLTVKKGGGVWFISAESPEDARRKIQAAEIDLLVIDEEVAGQLWEEGTARRLARGGRAVISACPIRGEAWMLDLEDQALTGDSDVVELWRFDLNRAVDAGHCKRSVLKEMEATFSEEKKQARIHGRSSVFSGLVYGEFRATNEHGEPWHVCEPFQIPDGWTRYCAIDPGFHVCAVLWAAVAPDGDVYFYDYLYETFTLATVVADKIHAKERYRYDGVAKRWSFEDATHRIEVRWIDPSAFRAAESGNDGVADLLGKDPLLGGGGLDLAPAFNRIDTGIEAVKQGLLPTMSGTPRFKFFRTLAPIFKEFRAYKRETGTTSTAVKKLGTPKPGADHLMDCLRYLAAGALTYRQPDLGFERRRRLAEFKVPDVPSAIGMKERLERFWARELLRQSEGESSRPRPCVGGLGTEY